MRDQLLLQNNALASLAREPALAAGDFDVAVRRITETASRILGVERASVWLFNAEQSRMTCIDLYERGAHSAGAQIAAADCPAYFAALDEAGLIVADDARSDPRIRECAGDYLLPNDIFSLMDAPILAGGELVGVICVEHVGKKRKWSAVEQNFAGSLAHFICLARETCKRKETEATLRKAGEELERRVAERTAALELSNEELQRAAAEREQTELALQKSRMINMEAQAIAHLGYWSWQVESNKVTWSDGSYRIFGRTREQLGDTYESFLATLHPDDRERVAQAVEQSIRTGESYRCEYRVVLPDGKTVRSVDAQGKTALHPETGEPISLIGTVLDITERRATEAALKMREEELRRTRKLESIGTLAGGVAHDFNNVCAGIMASVELALNQTPPDDPRHPLLKNALTAVERGRDVVRHLLHFARKENAQPKVLCLDELISEVAVLSRAAFDPRVRVVEQVEAGPFFLRGDYGHLHQVLMNLCINARDAVLEKGDGEVILAVRSAVDVPESVTRKNTSGPYVLIEVKDNGAGIPEAIMDRIMEPFFTTKEVGKGTGLGLSTAYGIIEAHGGLISCDSVVGEGTRFQVFLPALAERPEEDDAKNRRDKRAATGAVALRSTRRVLVVEDEEILREMISGHLSGCGYDVTMAEDGHVALEHVAGSGAFHLVLMDLMIPKLGGEELVQRILETQPDLPVIVMTGYVDNAVMARVEALGCKGLLEKPFSLDTLTDELERHLDGNEPPKSREASG